LHAHTEAQARRILEERPELLHAAVSALLIGATDFFRDALVFEALLTHVVPDLARRRRPLRVWSAGCSHGSELYSLAILLAEAGLLEGSFLLGSDCRREAIEQAQASLYNSHDLRTLAASDRRRYGEEADGLWRPAEPLRRHVHWKVADLGRSIEQGPWDLILWRNMAIYLKADAAAAVWQGLFSVLAHEGVLVAGRAERPPAELPLTCVRSCIYRARRAADRDGARARSRPVSYRPEQIPETGL
jgi:chemotaxis methyl-accepting protein methylase